MTGRREIALFLAPLLVVTLAGAPGIAQQGTDNSLWRFLEMPAHRALQRLRARPGVSLAPFTTDGCSGGLSEGWKLAASLLPGFAESEGAVPPWEGCCVVHDHAYHSAGEGTESESGAEASYAARLAADRALRQCVAATPEPDIEAEAAHYGIDPARLREIYGLIAATMYGAVRLGGMPCTAAPWRWGYGYPDCGWGAWP